MMPTHLKIAMFTRGGVGPFRALDAPWADHDNEWLIVERRDKQLWISDGNIPAEPVDQMAGGAAPLGMVENTTMFGTHVATTPDGLASKFVLSGFAPMDDHLSGSFRPVSGVVWLRLVGGRLLLEAQGDHSEACLGEAGVPWSNAHAQRRPRRWVLSAVWRPWASEQTRSDPSHGLGDDPRSEPFALQPVQGLTVRSSPSDGQPTRM